MFDGMTAAQIKSLIQQAQEAYQEAYDREQTLQGERSARIQEAIDQLTVLIGEDDGVPSTETLRGMQNYSDQEIAQNAVLAVRLILGSLERIALTTRDIAESVA